MKKKEKKSNSIDLAYIADVSVLTNPVIYANIVFNIRINVCFFRDKRTNRYGFPEKIISFQPEQNGNPPGKIYLLDEHMKPPGKTIFIR